MSSLWGIAECWCGIGVDKCANCKQLDAAEAAIKDQERKRLIEAFKVQVDKEKAEWAIGIINEHSGK